MRVVNHHKRVIHQPKSEVSPLFDSLGLLEDKIWPYENWPSIRFKNGLKVGNHGRHGRISYTVIAYSAGNSILFKFTKPEGFNGTHELRIKRISEDSTEISHIIDIKTSIKATFIWLFVIRCLHNALIVEAFDKVENYFLIKKKTTPYSIWVKILRNAYKRQSVKTNIA